MASGNTAGELPELAVLFPAPRSVVIAGRTVEIKRCGLGQAGRIISAGYSLYLHLQGDDTSFLELFEKFPEESALTLAAAVDEPVEWIRGLDALTKCDLALHWREVNEAFFAQRLLPLVARDITVTNAMFGDGATSSATSTSTDTPAPPITPRRPPTVTSKPSTARSDAVASPT